jgi:hypothetical protein
MKTREMDSRSFWVIQSVRRNTVDKVCPLSMYCSQGSWCSTNLKWVWAGVWVWEIVLEWGSRLEPFYRPKAQVTREEYIEAIERWLQQTTSCDHAPHSSLRRRLAMHHDLNDYDLAIMPRPCLPYPSCCTAPNHLPPDHVLLTLCFMPQSWPQCLGTLFSTWHWNMARDIAIVRRWTSERLPGIQRSWV